MTKENSQDLSVRGPMLLTAFFVAALVTSTLIGSKLILVGSITLSAGIFIFPFTFLTLDIMADLYGKPAARNLIKVGMFVQPFILLFVWIGGMLPSSPLRDLGDAYEKMFSLTGRMVLASLSAYLFSQLVDVSVFLKTKSKTKGRFLWLRTNLATLISQFIDTAIFCGIFLGGVIPLEALIKSGLTVYAAKVTLGFVNTPFVYLGVRLLRNK